jgi:predicted transcriptional regulator
VITNDTEKTVMSAQVPTALRDGLMRLAAEHDRSMSAEVRSALRDYLERSEGFSAGTSSAPAGAAGSHGQAPAGALLPPGEDAA